MFKATPRKLVAEVFGGGGIHSSSELPSYGTGAGAFFGGGAMQSSSELPS